MKIRGRIIQNVVTASLALTLLACGQEVGSPSFDPQITRLPSIGLAGSLAPNLAVGPDDELIMSWTEPSGDGYALRFAQFVDGHWDDPATVATGDNWFVNWADFPSVVPVSDQIWAAHWLARQPAGGYAYDVQLSISGDGGSTWSEPTLAHTDNTESEHGFLSIYPQDDGFGFVYLDGRKQVNEFTDDPNDTGMTLRSATLTSERVLKDEQLVDSLICDCCQTDVAMTVDGPVAVYRNRTENEIRDIYITRRVDGRWTQGQPVSNDGWEIPGCPVNGPEIYADGKDVVVAWFTAADDIPKVKFARSTDSGKKFSAPLQISETGTTGHVGLSVDHNGDAWVIWQTSAGDGEVELTVRRVTANDQMSTIHKITAKGEAAAISVPQIATQGEQLILAWTEGEYGSTRIVTAEVRLPGRD
jgi:hypothetical protein